MARSIDDLVTPRLRLQAMTLQSVTAAKRGEAALAEALKKECAPGCLDPSFTRVLDDLAACLAEDSGLPAWNRWVIRREGDCVIGTIGFLTRPDSHGVVELGYTISPREQNLGYATEAARELISFAFSRPSVWTITAMCREDNAASIKVLQKNNFHRTDDYGPVWGWELTRRAFEAAQKRRS